MIGVGGRGQELLKQVLELRDIQLVAIADIYSRRREEAKKAAPGVQTLDDHRRLLEMHDIDGVIVASPLHIHARHFMDTLAAGKDLYAEKTMTWSIPEADQCLQAAKRSDRVIQIGLQHESSGALADAKKWIQDGLVGKVTQVESWMSRNTPHRKGQWVRPVPPDCTPQNVNWAAFLNGRPERPFDPFKLINWRLFWEFSGGNVTENMVHQIAWIMTALDLPLPSAAYMSGGVFSEKDGPKCRIRLRWHWISPTIPSLPGNPLSAIAVTGWGSISSEATALSSMSREPTTWFVTTLKKALAIFPRR